jgi:hypothetical protein
MTATVQNRYKPFATTPGYGDRLHWVDDFRWLLQDVPRSRGPFELQALRDSARVAPLAWHIDLLAAQLATDGYSRVHTRLQLRLVGHFNRCLEHKDLRAEQINEEMIEHYWRYFIEKSGCAPKTCVPDEATRYLREEALRPGAPSKQFRPRARHYILHSKAGDGTGSVQAKHMVSSPRSFFRYLRHTGEIDTDLAGCVPCGYHFR